MAVSNLAKRMDFGLQIKPYDVEIDVEMFLETRAHPNLMDHHVPDELEATWPKDLGMS